MVGYKRLLDCSKDIGERAVAMAGYYRSTDFTYFDLNTLKGIKELEYQSTYETNQIELNGININYSASSITIEKNNNVIKNNNSGICFILKKDNGYIVYVNAGFPYAIDTNGRTYSEDEAMFYQRIQRLAPD